MYRFFYKICKNNIDDDKLAGIEKVKHLAMLLLNLYFTLHSGLAQIPRVREI